MRVDLNVPMQDGEVTDDTRLRATLPTVTELADKGAIVLLLAHFGRPKGARSPDMSLALVTRPYERGARPPGALRRDCGGRDAGERRDAAARRRRHPREYPLPRRRGEERPGAGRERMAALGDFYVNDAFSAAHRAHASTEGLAHLLPAYAGRAMEAELKALEKALGEPGAAGRGGGRRRQGLDQARRARATWSPRSII